MSETLGLKNVNMLSKERYNGIAKPATDELYAISGSGFGFPSDRFIDLELGANATRYTAPANGWFELRKWSTINESFLELYNANSNIVNTQFKYGTANMQYSVYIPTKKGDVVIANYTFNGETTMFRFIYAEGEE